MYNNLDSLITKYSKEELQKKFEEELEQAYKKQNNAEDIKKVISAIEQNLKTYAKLINKPYNTYFKSIPEALRIFANNPNNSSIEIRSQTYDI